MKTCPRSPLPRPPVDKTTHDCENITFPQTSFAGGKNSVEAIRIGINSQDQFECSYTYMAYNGNVCEHDVVQHLGLSVYFYIQMITRYNSNYRYMALDSSRIEQQFENIGGSRGRHAPPPPNWGFKFFHFHAVFGKKNCKIIALWEFAPLLRKILDLPLWYAGFLITVWILHYVISFSLSFRCEVYSYKTIKQYVTV